jgi:transcriptional regulator with XRE-family HTH domain
MEQGRPSGFGELLRRHRVAAGLTQEVLAERAGVSVRTVSDLERGINRSPRKDTLALLAAALGLAPSERVALETAARTGAAGPAALPMSAPRRPACRGAGGTGGKTGRRGGARR